MLRLDFTVWMNLKQSTFGKRFSCDHANTRIISSETLCFSSSDIQNLYDNFTTRRVGTSDTVTHVRKTALVDCIFVAITYLKLRKHCSKNIIKQRHIKVIKVHGL